MTQVPNNFQFTLQDVVDVIIPTDDTLDGCFDAADEGSFDDNFKGDKTSLRNFRNYGGDSVLLDFISYGYLYNWFAITNAKGIANAGYRVPTKTEWEDALIFLIETEMGIADTGPVVKSARTQLGPEGEEVGIPTSEHPRFNYHENRYGLDSLNLSFVPGGTTSSTMLFSKIGEHARYWASTQESSDFGDSFYTSYGEGAWTEVANTKLTYRRFSKWGGLSVRLVRDATTIEKENLEDGSYAGDYTGNDGKKYNTVKIGELVWTVQNLAETKYSDNTTIPLLTYEDEEATNAWSNDTNGARCAYDDEESYVFTHTDWESDLPQELILLTNPDILVLNVAGAGIKEIDETVNIDTWENVEIGEDPQYEFVNWTVISGETPTNFNPNTQQQTITFKGACTLTANWSEI